MPYADALSRNVGSVSYEENVTEARLREAQQNDTFCNALNDDNEFYRSDSYLLYSIISSTSVRSITVLEINLESVHLWRMWFGRPR